MVVGAPALPPLSEGAAWGLSLRRSKVTAINPGLPDPLGQAADWQPHPLGNCRAAQALTEAVRNSLLLLLRREPAPGLSRVGHRWTV
jgi:hypothetical protein